MFDIVGREASDNSLRAIQLIHWAGRRPFLILSTDLEKVFDLVDLPYLKVVLEALGLRLNMLTWIMALCSAPSAHVKVDSLYSSGFPIKNGTRQGCPLSPLFALVLEPFFTHCKGEPEYYRSDGGQY